MSQQTTIQCSGATFISFSNKSTNYSSLSSIPTCWPFYAADDSDFRQQLNQKSDTMDFGGAVFDFDPGNNFINKKINSVTLHYTIRAINSSKLKLGLYFCEGIDSGYTATTPITQLDYYSYFDSRSYGGNTQRNELIEYIDSSTSSLDRSVTISGYETKHTLEVGDILRTTISVGANENSADTLIFSINSSQYSARNNTGTFTTRAIDKSSVYIVVDWDYVKPDTPTQNSPINSSFVEDEPITFSWNYHSSISSPQASATIEYKLSSASTWTTATSSGTSTTWTLSAGLSVGSYQWRVKVTDEQGETSSYSATKTFTVVEQAAPTPTYPVDTGLPAYAPIAFAWTFNKPSGSSATQAGATLQYRERGSNIWIEEEITGTSTTWTLSAGLSVGQYEWRVKTENNFGNESSYSNIKYFQIVAQSAPTPLAPGDNITLFEGHDITFTWLYNSLTPATQASATIKYRVIGGSTWTTYTSASANPFCTISDIPQGQYEWCLNITNNYGETSADSSTLEFNIIGRPQRPIILTPDNCCLTTISWNASGQEAAEFILMDGNDNVLIHETVATAVTSYKPQMFLKGTYKAMARIKNNSDLWSDYGELEFTIDAAAPSAGNLIAMPFDTEIKLEGTYTSENAAIVRIDEDGTENVLSMTASAVDKRVASGLEYAYVLRCWNSGGYVDTPTKVFTFNFPGSIFTTDTEELHLDRSEQKFIAHDEDVERQYAAMRYVGREYAVIERGEYTEQTLAKQFHVTKAQRRILDRLAKEKALFYRDSRGNAFKAAILGVSYNGYMDDAYIASIKLTRTAADEVIINV